jgi:hypothetical protein
MINKNDLGEAISGIRSGKSAQRTLASVQKAVDEGSTSHLVSEIVSSEKFANQNQEQAISQTMRSLEAFAETDRTLAVILMCDLWGIADDYQMHDVCDSIDLWLHDCDSGEVTRHLETIASSSSNPNKRRHHEQLIQTRKDSKKTKEP